MQKIIIFGNSGAGKSTLAKKLQEKHKLDHLDLDLLAWKSSVTPTRKPLAESSIDIEQFISTHSDWVIEGCYADLIEIALPHASEIIFINSDIETCINHCKNRPWEPHKYKTKEQQDDNLAMLIEWIKQYNSRDDEFSLKAHKRIFKLFNGRKSEIKQVAL